MKRPPPSPSLTEIRRFKDIDTEMYVTYILEILSRKKLLLRIHLFNVHLPASRKPPPKKILSMPLLQILK